MSLGLVLVVDDDSGLRGMVATALEITGYTVRQAGHGLEALEALQRETPCVILLDLMMPVMDGWTFRQQQLAHPSFATIPVVVMSAHHRAQQAARDLGATAYVVKPFDLDSLLHIVRTECTAQTP
jgi:CheY-like chemotaxis protein